MSSKALATRIPKLAKMAMTTARCGPLRRFLSTETSVKEGEEVSASAEGSSQNSATPPPTKNGSSRQRNRSNGRRNRVEFKLSEDRPNAAAAAAVATEENESTKSAESKQAQSQFPSTMTRLVDNHPLTEDDLDPHQFLINLTEDKLDRAPPTPLFDEETADHLPRSHRILGKDSNGNEIELLEKLPPKNEERMNQLGFYLSTPDMHGYSPIDTPLLLHKGPMDRFEGDPTDPTTIENEDEFARQTAATETLARQTDETPQTLSNPLAPTPSNETPDVKKGLEEGGDGDGDWDAEVPLAALNDFARLQFVGDWLEGSSLHPGSDIQMNLELEMLARNAQFQTLRRNALTRERGYVSRGSAAGEGEGWQPWVDTSRMEAIDARLRELHRMRNEGELEYPIEKDAANEAKRVQNELAIVRNTIWQMLGQSRESKEPRESKESREMGSLDQYLFAASPRRKAPQQAYPLAAKQRDEALDTMDVYAIPAEKLYQARRQELDRIRSMAYEDFDLDYLLAKSGKTFENRGNAASLYEIRHGYNEIPRNAIPAGMDARMAGREMLLLDGMERIAKKDMGGIYRGKVRMITEDMEKALEDLAAKEASEDGESGESGETGETGEGEEMEEEVNETTTSVTPFTLESLHTSETADHMLDDYTVSDNLVTAKRPPSAMKRPLQDVEMGVSPQGDLSLFWRQNREKAGDFNNDKQAFFSQVEELINHGDETVTDADMSHVITPEEMDESRQNLGLPPDISGEVFHERYLKGWSGRRENGRLVTEVLSGVSVEEGEKLAKGLGIGSEEEMEKYLMGVFDKKGGAVEEELFWEVGRAKKVREHADRVIEGLKKRLGVGKDEEIGEDGDEVTNKVTNKMANEVSNEGEKKEVEIKQTMENETPNETPTETPKDVSTNDESLQASETPNETPNETPSESELPPDYPDDASSEANPPSLEDSFNALLTRYSEASEEAMASIPDETAGLEGEGHLVDALEYADEVYVHEKDRKLIYALYQQGASPREISRSVGFAESRVTAIIRLMGDRERKEKEGMVGGKWLDELESRESVWSYEYRDFPPSSYRMEDSRRRAKLPTYLPKFLFLKEGEEEGNVMRDVESLIHRNNRGKDPKIIRKEMKMGEDKMAKGLDKHTYKIAFMDLSRGAKHRVVISDHDGSLRKGTQEEVVHRSWKRHELRSSERLLRRKL